jgi:hypothetical protein
MADQEFVFDGRDLEDLARNMRIASKDFRREVQPEVDAIGKDIADTARDVAATKSERVAATVHHLSLPELGASVVRAGDDSTPIAALWELGNKGSKRTADTFRHPVFGNRDGAWVEQEKFPYLSAALVLRRREMTKRMEQAWNRALRVVGVRAE